MKSTPPFKHRGHSDATRSSAYNEKKDLPTDHIVTIVGWDDSKKAWLIRKSWGTNWGMNGYGWLGYDSSNIGYDACWIDARPLFSKRIKVDNLIGTGSFNTDLVLARYRGIPPRGRPQFPRRPERQKSKYRVMQPMCG